MSKKPISNGSTDLLNVFKLFIERDVAVPVAAMNTLLVRIKVSPNLTKLSDERKNTILRVQLYSYTTTHPCFQLPL